jgi:hypothetical protein
LSSELRALKAPSAVYFIQLAWLGTLILLSRGQWDVGLSRAGGDELLYGQSSCSHHRTASAGLPGPNE